MVSDKTKDGSTTTAADSEPGRPSPDALALEHASPENMPPDSVHDEDREEDEGRSLAFVYVMFAFLVGITVIGWYVASQLF